MTAQPVASGPDTGSYEVIHLGGQAAVVVPVADFLRLRALEQAASPQDLEDAEDTRRYWSGAPGTLLARRRLSPRMRCGAGSGVDRPSACPVKRNVGNLRKHPRLGLFHDHGPKWAVSGQNDP